MSGVTKKIVVCGGNGFLGSRICKYAVAKGWDVTSISRSGEPRWEAVSSSSTPPTWAHKVSWERGDMLQPTTYSSLLKNASSVVHSMGILLEADYKGVLQGQESPIAGLRRAFAPADSSHIRSRSQNPLQRSPDQGIAPDNPRDQLSYEVMNRDSAVMLARQAAEAKVPAFCYVSAADGAPILPGRYISTKREAEALIEKNFPSMRGVFVRPPFMYDSSRAITMPLAAMTGVGAAINNIFGGALSGLMGAGGVKPLKVDLVAEAVVEALADESVRGPVEVPELERLSERSWRKNML